MRLRRLGLWRAACGGLLFLAALALACDGLSSAPGQPSEAVTPSAATSSAATLPPAKTPTPTQATPTPTPASPTPTSATPAPAAAEAGAGAAPCLIVVRTPAPEAPTASSQGTPLPRQVDPHVEICAGARQVRVGETLTVVGQAVDIGLPYFVLSARDQGGAGLRQIAQVTYDGQVSGLLGGSKLLEFVAAEASLSQVVVTLRATAAGSTELAIGATGEIHYGYPGPATWGGGGSERIQISVVP